MTVATDRAIRPATVADLERIVDMAQTFCQTTPYGSRVPADADHLRRVAEQLLTVGVVLVVERDGQIVGMLAGVAYPHYLTGVMTASETALWVEPSARGARLAKDLIAAFEEWAGQHCATRVELGSWHESLDRFYGRLGYAAAERTFYKELS